MPPPLTVQDILGQPGSGDDPNNPNTPKRPPQPMGNDLMPQPIANVRTGANITPPDGGNDLLPPGASAHTEDGNPANVRITGVDAAGRGALGITPPPRFATGGDGTLTPVNTDNDLIQQQRQIEMATRSPASPPPNFGESAPPSSVTGTGTGAAGLPSIREPNIMSTVANRPPALGIDINALPATERLNKVRGLLDQSRKPMTTGTRWATLGLEAAIPAIAAIFGGRHGASGAAAGVTESLNTQFAKRKAEQDELLREEQSAQAAQTGQYEGQLHLAGLNAQNASTNAYRDALLRSRGDIAGQNNAVKLNVAGQRNATTDLIHGYNSDGTPIDTANLSQRDQAYVQHAKAQEDLMAAQERLANARAEGIPQQIAAAEAWHHSMEMRAQIAQDNFEAMMFGTYRGKPIPGAPVVKDAAGNDTVEGFKPYAATGPTGTTRTKIDQANAIKASSDNLVAFIKEHGKELGPVMGRVNNLEDLIGNVGPDASELRALITSYAALHPALHGFRGQTALKGFEDAIGGMKKNPEAMIAAIEGLTKSAGVAKEGFKGSNQGYIKPVPPTPAPATGQGRGKNPLNLNLPGMGQPQ